MDIHNSNDVQAAERIFRKIVHPGLQSLRLVDRNGIPLQSPTGSIRNRSFVLSPRGVPTKVSNHIYSGQHSHIARYRDGLSRTGTPDYYTENSVVMPSNFGTTNSAPQYGMPKRRTFPRKPHRNGLTPKSACLDRQLSDTYDDRRYPQSAGSGSSRWNMSSQNMRLEKEWSEVANSRTLKRNAEILSHRVDRMYFMTGRSVQIKPRFQVDDEELKQLQDLSKSRQSSRQAHRIILPDCAGRNSSRGVRIARTGKKDGFSKGDPVENEINCNGEGEENSEVSPKLDPSDENKNAGLKSPFEGWESPTKEESPEQGELIRKMSLHENIADEDGNKDLDIKEDGENEIEVGAENELDNSNCDNTEIRNMTEEINDNTQEDNKDGVVENDSINENDKDDNENYEENEGDVKVNVTVNVLERRPDGRKSEDDENELGQDIKEEDTS